MVVYTPLSGWAGFVGRRSVGGLLALGLGACSPPTVHLVPPEGARSALLVAEGAEDWVRLAASLTPARELELPDEVQDQASAHVLYYRWSLAELQLQHGVIAPPPAGARVRTFPPPEALYSGRLGGESLTWTPIGDDPELRRRHRLPALDLVRCAQAGGCLARSEDTQVACTLPCPEVSLPTPPAAPEGLERLLEDLEPVEPPRLVPCPTGWTLRASAGEEPPACDPPSVAPWTDCPSGEVRFFGEAGCAPLGSSCPAGPFAAPVDLPPGWPTFYVQRGAPPGGDGSLGAPFSSIGVALQAVPSRSVLLLSRGVFEEQVLVEREVAIIGACPAETIVQLPASEPCCEPVLRVFVYPEPRAIVRNLQVRGPSNTLRVTGQTALELRDVWLEPQTDRSWGLVAYEGAVVTGSRLVIRGQGDDALHTSSGAQIALESVFIEAGGNAIRVSGDGALMQLRGVVVRDATDGALRRSVLVSDGGRLEVEGLRFERRQAQALVLAERASAQILDLTVAHVGGAPSPAGAMEPMVVLESGADLTVERGDFEGSRGRLVSVEGRGSRLALVDTIVRGAESPFLDRDFGALHVHDATVALARVRLEENAGPGLWLSGAARAHLQDVVFRDNGRQHESDVGGGAALYAEGSSGLELERAYVTDNALTGLQLRGSSTATVSDLVVRRTRALHVGDTADGAGILMADRSRLRLERAALGDNDGPALRLSGAVTATVGPVRLGARTGSQTPQADVLARGAAQLVLRAARIEGLRVHAESSRVRLEDSLVAVGEVDAPAITAQDGSRVVLERVLIEQDAPLVPLVEVDRSPAELIDVALRGGFLNARDAPLSLVRVDVEAGDVTLRGAARFEAEDLEVRRSQRSGLNLGVGSTARLRRVRVVDAGERGVRVAEEATLDAEDLILEGNRVGLAAFVDTRASIHRLLAARNQDAGLVIEPATLGTRAGELWVVEGLIASQPVGLRVSTAYDLSRVMVRVRYESLLRPVEY